MIRFVPWSEVGTIEVSPGDDVVEVGDFELAEGADTLWVRMTNTGTPGPWPWSYGILSFKTEEGQPLGSIKAYNSFDGEVFRLGVGLTPSVRSGVLTFEPRGFNMAWIKQGNPWSLKFEAQAGSGGGVSTSYWSRIPGVLAPTEAGDDVNLDTGSLIASSVSFASGQGLLSADGSIESVFGRVTCGRSHSTSATDRSGVELRGGTSRGYGNILIQAPVGTDSSKDILSARNGATEVWSVNWSGQSTFRSGVSTTDVALISSDPALYRGGDPDTYVGPSLSLVDEIVRLEALVRDLYEKLRMTPPAGWDVWDGNTDLVKSRGKKNGHI